MKQIKILLAKNYKQDWRKHSSSIHPPQKRPPNFLGRLWTACLSWKQKHVMWQNRGKLWESNTQESLLAWATSVLLSYDHWITTNPHNPLYVLDRWYWMLQSHASTPALRCLLDVRLYDFSNSNCVAPPKYSLQLLQLWHTTEWKNFHHKYKTVHVLIASCEQPPAT